MIAKYNLCAVMDKKVFSIVEMLVQLFLLIWIARNGTQAIPGGSILTACLLLFLKDKVSFVKTSFTCHACELVGVSLPH